MRIPVATALFLVVAVILHLAITNQAQLFGGASASANTVTHFRGISPSDLSGYALNTELFECADGEKSIPRSFVNDDFCDCRDGSDEPGTSACPNAKFYCANKGFKPQYVFSSRVNDGICDCCDGSDEWNGRVHCANTCDEDGKEWRESTQRELNAYMKGLSLRNQMVEEAKKALKEKQVQLDELSPRVNELEAQLAIVAETKKQAEEQEEEARATRRAELEVEFSERRKGQYVRDDEDGHERVVAVEAVRSDEEELEAAAGMETEPVDESPEQKDEQQIESLVKLFHIEAADHARDQYNEVETELKRLRRNVEDLRKVLDMDFGPDQVYYSLYGKCIEHQSREYTYEVCPFDRAAQKQNGSPTSLGSFDRWNADYTQLFFTNGLRCWQGPERTMTVQVKCSDQNSLGQVEEPNKCVYTSTLLTPAACSSKDYSELKTQLEAVTHQ